MAPTCTDGIKDFTETDVDCGGPDCQACSGGQTCGAGTDCTSGICAINADPATAKNPNPPAACANELCCMPGSCTDGIRDGAETDVDCGGPGCKPCATPLHCLADTDCASLNCSEATFQCQPPAVCSSGNAGIAADAGIPWTAYTPDGG